MLAKENLLALRAKIKALSAPGIEMDKPRKTKKRQLEDMYEAALKKQRAAMEEAGEDPAQLMRELEEAASSSRAQAGAPRSPCRRTCRQSFVRRSWCTRDAKKSTAYLPSAFLRGKPRGLTTNESEVSSRGNRRISAYVLGVLRCSWCVQPSEENNNPLCCCNERGHHQHSACRCNPPLFARWPVGSRCGLPSFAAAKRRSQPTLGQNT